MKEGRSLQNILLVSGLVGMLLLAFVFDLIIQNLIQINTQSGTLMVVLVWLFPLLQFLWLLAPIGLVWLMISGGGYGRWVSWVFLIFGLAFLYINPVLFVNELPDSLYVIVQYLTPGSLLIQGAGAAAAIGLLSLWFWKPPSISEEEEVEVEEIEAAVEVDKNGEPG